MNGKQPTDQQTEDAAVTALLRRLEKVGVARQVLADMTDAEQAAVLAAEARATSAGRTPK